MNLPGKLVHRESDGQHEIEVYEHNGYYQGQYRGINGHLPTLWNRGYGGRDVQKAIGEMRNRCAWEHVAAADRG